MLCSNFLRISLVAFASVAFAAVAQAGPITSVTLDDCATCEGADLFLSVEEEAGGSWLVTYTINTDVNTSGRTGFNQIGFKAIKDWTSADLVSADPNLAAWSAPVESQINSNSLCDGSNGNTDKVCIYGYTDITGGGDHTWVFRLFGGTLLDTSDWHLGAQYANSAAEARGKIISEEGGAPVPEPTAALLFGAGALVISQRARRR